MTEKLKEKLKILLSVGIKKYYSKKHFHILTGININQNKKLRESKYIKIRESKRVNKYGTKFKRVLVDLESIENDVLSH